MNRHQILSGACNSGDKCYAVGSVEGVPFTAYAAGCNIVILASTFERVQIIPGAIHGYVRISALDCSTDTGKISASYEEKVCVFEPTPLLHTDLTSSHNLDYRWVHTGSLYANSRITSLSWNLEGTRLLTGGISLQMWKEKEVQEGTCRAVKFEIGCDRDAQAQESEKNERISWECIWMCETSIPVYHMAFSPDGTLFATSGKNDRLVKVWYESKQALFPTLQYSLEITEETNLKFSYVYIAHPRAITHISWRKTSKYMPKGSVSNMLVSSCLDNICRIWVETVLPDDGLVNMTQFDTIAMQHPKYRTHRHKHRFIQRLKHMKTCFHIRRYAKNISEGANDTLGFNYIDGDNYKQQPIPSFPSSCSVHDFHSYGFYGTGISPTLHFHLAASINAETDIPLVPSIHTTDPANQHNFILHWLNNKEMHFSLQAEIILQELTRKIIEKEYNFYNDSNDTDEMGNEIYIAKGSKFFVQESGKLEENQKNFVKYTNVGNPSYINTMSSTTSTNSLLFENQSMHCRDSLDTKIDSLLRDWHHSPDLLFSIHPIDGSYLIWVIEWLDDYYPGSFRQAQISFSTRIPSAFPLGDAMSMSTTVSLYNTGSTPLYFREVVKGVKNQVISTMSEVSEQNETTFADLLEDQGVTEENNSSINKSNNKQQNKADSQCEDGEVNLNEQTISTSPSPSISMVTKHSNGTLNLWQLTFSDKTKFTQVLSIGHVSRASGHRFRVNDITCHPVLPLLLTTSHHNVPDTDKVNLSSSEKPSRHRDIVSSAGFCSELILWRVDAVGPLSHSGGVSELARINSPEISAFSNVAWIPTLLPSTTLGGYSNSPSACFVASDGQNLCVYQAVIDARTLLAEISCSERFNNRINSVNSVYSECSSDFADNIIMHDKIKVVSQQSTSRPGCIIQLDVISDATHDWQNTQFLHVFQEELITGEKKKSGNIAPSSINYLEGIDKNLNSLVDFQSNVEFEESFYIVIIEKTHSGSTLHMWKIIIASKYNAPHFSETAMYVPDSSIVQDIDDQEVNPRHSISGLNLSENRKLNLDTPHIAIITKKVCTQNLLLPDGVDVIHASPTAGHLSSSSIYPACFAPYIIVTACSDSVSRFWKCSVNKNMTRHHYNWCEWKMFNKSLESAIQIPGQPLNISAAYSGRIACAFKYGRSFTRPNKGDTESRYVNLCVAIYECESTGGSEWVLEDTIHLRNVHLPRIQLDPNLDLSYLHDNKFLQKKQRLNQVIHNFTHDENRLPRNGEVTSDTGSKSSGGLLAVPSFSTLQSLRKSISENGNTCPLTQKHIVQLDWVSKEDGSHILTVAVGSKILLYTSVSTDVAQANIKAMKESQSKNRPVLRKASSLVQPHFNDEIRWMKLRQIDLQTADGLPPLPMQISWVRDGILVVGMDSEMHVYSQWKPKLYELRNVDDLFDSRSIKDEDLRSLNQDIKQRKLTAVCSMPQLARGYSLNHQMFTSDKKKKMTHSAGHISGKIVKLQNFDYMKDYGLFQASRLACPVLPQYHPKQLMELLNSGKIRWVKAILSHLVHCVSGTYNQGVQDDDNMAKQRTWSRSRTLSMSYVETAINTQSEHRASASQIPEELMLDYTEISSIPPLPLWILLAADRESHLQNKEEEKMKDYDELFESKNSADDCLEDLLDSDNNSPTFDRNASMPEKYNVSFFGPRQGQLLSQLLTHTHLPGLSSLDQMHLLALADTVATCNTDFSEKFVADANKSVSKRESVNEEVDLENTSADALDDCGLRFLLAMKHYNYLLRCLPYNQRSQFQKQGVGTGNIVWAFHSESEEELLNLIPCYSKGQIKWSTLKELGVGWWLRSNTLLKQCMEKLAKTAYQLRQDPLDAAIYYLAMKKKSIVWGLFRSQKDEKMTTFFSNNFQENRWRKAALKNAFVLLGKQRFEHAVAFFLLANSLTDAVEVCLNKLEDIQLALVITRLFEGEHNLTPPTYKKLLFEEILGCDEEGNNQDLSKCHPDPFLRSMALWILKNYPASLNTLLLNNVGHNHHEHYEVNSDSFRENSPATNPNVFNFYIYLRTHPLLLRQHLAFTAKEKKQAQVIISGFSYNFEKSLKQPNDKQLHLEDAITSLERELYFTTAHGHFKAGCPVLALEVLNKLPLKVMESCNSEIITFDVEDKSKLIDTGILDWNEKDKNIHLRQNLKIQSEPIRTLKKTKLESYKMEKDNVKTDKVLPENVNHRNMPKSLVQEFDIMAQQLKFIACLKILMEELSTLATGFEVDGGQLRYQLYVWLEKEVDAIRQLCNYSTVENETLEEITTLDISKLCDKEKNSNNRISEKSSLYEILLQEKQEFEAKVQRAARRKCWLKANETLLRTLLSYCSLHGASGGGLASVRMELILLLQELQQEKTQQQLFSPLPFPTTLPLLSACVAGNKTVIADPIKYLQSYTQDMLQTIIEFKLPPVGFNDQNMYEIYILKDLAIALSSCIYQSLCDSENFIVHQSSYGGSYHNPGIESIAKLTASFRSTYLMINANMYRRKRKYSSDEPASIGTSPSKWPGVTNLRALLAREKDEDMPKLNIILLESFIATYMALLVYALCTCDCHLLYRLCGKVFSNLTWALLFGGGTKKLLRKATSHTPIHSSVQNLLTSEGNDVCGGDGVWSTVTSITKQRVKLNMKLLGNFTNPACSTDIKEDKPTYREQFVPPELSMVTFLLTKPEVTDEHDIEDYNTDDSSAFDEDISNTEEEVFESDCKDSSKFDKSKVENTEHLNPSSHSWCIMRLGIIKLVQNKLQEFINVAGIDMQELPVVSPLCHDILRILSTWQASLTEELQAKGPVPYNYIPGCFVETESKGAAIHKYQSLLEKHNTPFVYSPLTGSIRRLWSYLVHQEIIQDIFVRYIFGKKCYQFKKAYFENGNMEKKTTFMHDEDTSALSQISEPIRIIHKDHESISAFCINNALSGLMAIATPREIQEMDISLLLESPNWFEDECEYDVMNLSKDIDFLPASSFLVIQTPTDRSLLPSSNSNAPNYTSTSISQPGIAVQSGRGTSVVLKHKIDNIKRMCSHPIMPLYLTGGQDGSVQLWEWGHQQVVCTPRAPGAFAKVTRCRFSQHGNKFGIGDGDGNLSLWQASLVSQSSRPFFTYQCHNKNIADFVFLGSCSLVATAGYSSENKNVCIWDTLLPQKKALVTSFSCHDAGSSCLVYAPQHQILISSGKKGDVSIFDIRQRTLRHRFQAHETPIKCMAMDPNEEIYITGSSEGDIKIWDLSLNALMYCLPGEHAKNSFFKHMGQGVNQIFLDSCGRLFSCGSDGSMKVRQLLDKDLIVQSIY